MEAAAALREFLDSSPDASANEAIHRQLVRAVAALGGPFREDEVSLLPPDGVPYGRMCLSLLDVKWDAYNAGRRALETGRPGGE